MRTSPLEGLHRAAGARLAGGAPGAPLLTYGDVPAEYRAGRAGCLLLDETERGAVVVTGEQRAEFLHRLLANAVRGLAPGAGDANLLLSSKGKVLFAFDLSAGVGEVGLSCEPGAAPALLKALDMYLFADAVALADVTERHAPLALSGPRAAAVLGAVLGPLPELAPWHWREVAWQGAEVVVQPLPVAGSPGWRVDAGPERVEALWRALAAAGATPGGLVARDSLRVEAGFALPGVDVDENVYPQEARLERAFALDKGCYIGQEVVAKIDTYGGLNKRLVAVRLSADDPLPRGTVLLTDDADGPREVGLVTSWAYSFELDAPLALAYVKRRHQAAGTVLRPAGAEGSATVVALPVRADAWPVTGEFEPARA